MHAGATPPDGPIAEALAAGDLDTALAAALQALVPRLGARAALLLEREGDAAALAAAWPPSTAGSIPWPAPGPLANAPAAALGLEGARAEVRTLPGAPDARLVLCHVEASPAELSLQEALTLAALLAARRARRAHTRAERFGRALMLHAADPIFVTDAALRILEVNDRACDVLGRTREALLGRRIEEFIEPEELSAAPLQQAQLNDGAQTFTLRTFRRPDGTRRVLEVSAARVEPGVLLGIARDATKRLESEARIARSEASFRTVIESIPDGIAVHRGGRFLYCNPAMARMLRYDSPAGIVGRSVLEIVHPDDRATVAARVAKLHGGAETVPFVEERLIAGDGAVISAEIAGLDVLFQGERAVLAVGRDVTERRRLEARLAASDRMAAVGLLAAGIAHEINNPLTYVLLRLEGLAARLAQDAPGPAETLASVTNALEGSLRVQAIVRDLRAFGRTDEEATAIDVRKPIEAALRLATHELRHRAEVIVSLAEVPPVLGREGRLCQLLLNLLVNAAQSFDELAADDPRRRVVEVRCLAAEGHVQILVRDNGSGMPAAVRSRAFDPFFTTKAVGTGSGLGLAICREIAEEHGGRISLLPSDGPGTTALVLLPVATGHSSPPPSLPPAPSLRARVLLVDDELEIHAAIADALGASCTVVAVASAEAALAHLDHDDAFDVLLCDVRMPGLSGVELHARLAASRPALAARVVLMSGGTETLPGVRQLPKPFSVAALSEAVDAVLRSAGRGS